MKRGLFTPAGWDDNVTLEEVAQQANFFNNIFHSSHPERGMCVIWHTLHRLFNKKENKDDN